MPKTFQVSNPPNSLLKSSHGFQIKVNGITVGAIESFKPGPISRNVEYAYELNPLSSGHPIDRVPGNLSGFEIAITRADIWTVPFEKAFGGNISYYDALGRQKDPFEVYEFLWYPTGYKEVWVYRGCWLTRAGRSYSATGNRIVMVEGALAFLRKDRIA